MTDLYQAFSQGRAAGTQRRTNRTLSEHLRSATQGNTQSLDAIYQADPNAGMQAQKLARETQQDDMGDVAKAANFFSQTGDPKAYQYLHGRLATMPQFAGLPATLDTPEDQEGAKQFAAALVQTYGEQGKGNELPAEIQTLQMLQADPSLMALDKERRQAGWKPTLFQDQNGFNAFMPQTQTGVPVTAGGQVSPQAQQMPDRGDMEADIALANQMISAGIPEEQVDAFIAARGQRASGALPRQQAVSQQLRPRDPIQDAMAKARAEAQVKLETAPAMGAIEADAAAAKDAASARVELQQMLPKVESDSRSAITLIDKALSHPGRATATGMSGTVDPRNYAPGSDAKNFQVLLNQLKGKNFLQAFQSLKGGGAITQIEGQKAEEAIGRLDRAQSDDEFVEALKELRKIAEDAPAGLRAKIGAAMQTSPAAPRRLKFNPATGKLE